ncbi:MAG TPA: flagellar motor protein MotB [Phycisphaerales bacterium]|nr:flagellar motor protein MotB [Phycisphaerales bacterium]
MGKSRSRDHEGEGHASGGGHSSHGPHGHGGGGGHEEHEGAPEWLISFADNVMLMMGVFVILLALNMGKSSSAHSSTGDDSESQSAPAEGSGGYTDEELDFALAVREAFHNAVDIDSTDPEDGALVRRLRERLAGRSEEPALNPGPAEPALGAEEFARVGDVIAFPEFSAEIDPVSREVIAGLLPRLAGLRYAIEVRGHASLWETMHDPEQGYRLAYDRALSVARVLAEEGIAWERILIVSCGDSESRARGQAPDRAWSAAQRVEVLLSARRTPAPNAEQRGSP